MKAPSRASGGVFHLNGKDDINMDRTKIVSIVKHLGAACREWRKTQTNMTAEDMGKKLGVTQTTVSAFENGHTNNLYIFMGYVNEGFDPMESEEVWQALNTY